MTAGQSEAFLGMGEGEVRLDLWSDNTLGTDRQWKDRRTGCPPFSCWGRLVWEGQKGGKKRYSLT